MENESPALKIMRLAWKSRGSESWLQLNQSLYKILCGVIEVGATFEETDFAAINKEMHGGYWFGTSLNGHHFGEGLYRAACERNVSAAKSYEMSFSRTPFILGSKRVFEGFKFEYDGLHCHVTGWAKNNDKIKFVGYQNRNQEGKKKLFEMGREEWLSGRKEMKT